MRKKQITISESVMSRIAREHIAMKPKWYFVAGSLAMISGLIGSVIVSVFFVSLISFSLRTHGPMGEIRYQQLVANFPWWASVIALAGLGLGVWLLRVYDFSYKKNFLFIAVTFVAAILLSGFLINYFDIDRLWAKQGAMRRFYQRVENDDSVRMLRGQGRKGFNNLRR